MRILVISNYYPPFELGGWEQLTRDVVQRLEARGHHLQVLTSNYCAGRPSKEDPKVKRILHLESPDHVHYHPQYILTRRWKERKNQRSLIAAVKQFNPDGIFINGMWNLPMSIAQQAERLCPGRVTYYVASYWATEADAHTAYWQSGGNQALGGLLKRMARAIASRTLLPSSPRNQLAFERVLCVSQFMQKHMIKKAGANPLKTYVVHNGIDPAAFKMRELEHRSSTLKLLYAGRLSEDKGVHTAIESLALLPKSDLPVTLSIVGSGTPDYEARLRTLAHQRNIAELVEFTGHVPREQMPGILDAHDVLLLPSVWDEPLARMTQEGMACGLVVIGTTTGGTPEILHHGENGLTFEAANASMLAEWISLVAQDTELRIRLAKAARCTVEQNFSLTRMVDEIEEHLKLQATHFSFDADSIGDTGANEAGEESYKLPVGANS